MEVHAGRARAAPRDELTVPQITATEWGSGRKVHWDGAAFTGDPELAGAAAGFVATEESAAVTPTGPWVPLQPMSPVAAIAVLRTVMAGRADFSGDLPDAELAELTRLADGEIG